MREALDETTLLGALARASRVVATGLDIDAKLADIVEVACWLTGARYGALGVLGPDRRIARFITHGIPPEAARGIGPYPTGRGILGALIDNAEPLRLADLTADPRAVGFPPNHPPMRSFMGAPIVLEDEVFGNLYLCEREDGEEFSEEDEQLLVLLAAQSAAAIQNARAHTEAAARSEDARRAAEARASVVSVARSILRAPDVQHVFEAIVREAHRLVDARAVGIATPDFATGTLHYRATAGPDAASLMARPIPIEGTASGTALLAREPVRLDDTDDDALGPLLESPAARQALCVPLVGADDAHAVLVAVDREDGDAFHADDLEVLGALGLIGAIALETAGTLERERARSEALARVKRLEAERAGRREAMRRAFSTQEQERRRIAQDIHDRTGGLLTASMLSVSRIRREVDKGADAGDVSRQLESLRLDLAQVFDLLRDVIADLRPRVLDDHGLGPALERLARLVERRTGVSVRVHHELGRDALGDELATATFRIIQEALSNVARHSGGRTATVTVRARGGRLTALVDDDGVGIGELQEDYGIVGMRERATLVGGDLVIEPRPDGGTRVRFEAPL